MPGGFEALHDSFALTRRLMGVFRAIIQVAALAMFDTREQLALRRSVAGEFVGDDHPRDILAALQQLANELLGSSLVPSALHQDVLHVLILIHDPPEVVLLPLDREEDACYGRFVRTSTSEAGRLRIST